MPRRAGANPDPNPNCTCVPRAHRVRTALNAYCMYVCRDFELEIVRGDATALAIGAQLISDGEKLCFLDRNALKPPDGTNFTADELKAFFKKLVGEPASHALATT